MIDTRIKITGTLEEALKVHIEAEYGEEANVVNVVIKQALHRFLAPEKQLLSLLNLIKWIEEQGYKVSMNDQGQIAFQEKPRLAMRRVSRYPVAEKGISNGEMGTGS